MSLGYQPDYVYIFADSNLVWYYNKNNNENKFYAYNGGVRYFNINVDNRNENYPFNLFITNTGFRYSYQYCDAQVTYFAGQLD